MTDSLLAANLTDSRTSTGTITRAFDLSLAVPALILTSPILAITLLVSWLTYRANPLFVHTRVGQFGEEFNLYKMRTLPVSADPYMDKYSIQPAILPVHMRVMRRIHLDELPQLVQVITGRMSLVGPRPEMPMLHDKIPTIARLEREMVRPGITGLWQVSEVCDGLIYENSDFDLVYSQNKSLRLDLWVLAMTFRMLVFGSQVQPEEISAFLGDDNVFWSSPQLTSSAK